MSFEELQKKWGDQFSRQGKAPDPKIEMELLEQIRRKERRFRQVVILMALKDAVFLCLCCLMLAMAVFHVVPLAKGRPVAVAGVAVAVVLTVATRRCSQSRVLPGARKTSQASSPAPGDGPLPSTIRRDSSRFDAMVLWRDLREAFAGSVVIFMAVFSAWHANRYASLFWVAAVIFAIPVVSFLAYRYRTLALRPSTDDSLLGVLTLSIYQIRRQIRLLENIWWYVGPCLAGGLLIGPIRMSLIRGTINANAIVGTVTFIALSWGLWKLNRSAAQDRLRPRLEQLEKLKADLSNDPLINQPPTS